MDQGLTPLCDGQVRPIFNAPVSCFGCGRTHALEFRYHHMNIQSPTNEQAGTEPSGARGIGSEVRQTRKIRKMSNENQNNSNKNIPQPQNGEKRLETGALASTFPSDFQAIATAYGDYT